MFADKEEFKKAFKEQMESVYGRSVASSHKTEQYVLLAQMIRNYVGKNWKGTKEAVARNHQKQLYYFSMEFLLGKMLRNNLMNLGVYDVVREGLKEMGISLKDLEDMEQDAGLGNGGLGRLAACFMDSIASMNYAGNGNCLRYEYGLFRQKIVDHKQVEAPDTWLKYGNPWEIRKPQHAVDVKFGGRLDWTWEDGHMRFDLIDPVIVRAVPYDMPMIGYHTKTTNTLRLWHAECSSKAQEKDFHQYIQDVNAINMNVYPDDSTEEGRLLRVKQEYFFVSAGIQTAVKTHMDVYHTLDNLADKVVFQLNDTHPTLVIPELLRILLDDYHYEWDDAWNIVTHCVAYTNHTVMAEALETWPEAYIETLLPRIYSLIKEINKRYRREAWEKTHSHDFLKRTSIIHDGSVYMANLDVVAAYSVNGVAELHTRILKEDVFRDYYKLYPHKFNNKTNGITHRRWLMYANPELTELLADTIGTGWQTKPAELEKLMKHVDDANVQERFAQVKRKRKEILRDYVKEQTGIEMDPDSIYDGMAKRLHAYKRQLLNILHVICLYQRMKEDSSFRIHPHTFLFSAKAASSYVFAKEVIELINAVADVVNQDPQTSPYMKVVFIPNYSVSVSEVLMPAADISEQISTAGKEASGTGNMKYMMNGAITLGTYDGANVEIDRLVGRDNDVIFGHTVEELEDLRFNEYDARELYEKDRRIKNAVDSLIDGTWDPDVNEFKDVYDDLMVNNDPFFVLADFDAYVKAQEEIVRRYEDRPAWLRSCLVNVAKSGYFSSDRTIGEYVRDIWHLEPVKGIR